MTPDTIPTIKPQELRIGNLVRLRHMDYCNIVVVTIIGRACLRGHFIGRDDENIMWGYDDLEPIPVTPELLTKLGWERGETYHEGDMCGVWCDSDDAFAYRLFESEPFPPLHILQNRYYFNTSKELDVTPLLK